MLSRLSKETVWWFRDKVLRKTNISIKTPCVNTSKSQFKIYSNIPLQRLLLKWSTALLVGCCSWAGLQAPAQHALLFGNHSWEQKTDCISSYLYFFKSQMETLPALTPTDVSTARKTLTAMLLLSSSSSRHWREYKGVQELKAAGIKPKTVCQRQAPRTAGGRKGFLTLGRYLQSFLSLFLQWFLSSVHLLYNS